MKRKLQPASNDGARGLQNEWAPYSELLYSLRHRLAEDRDHQRAETGEPLIPDTNDQADCATDEFDRDLAFSLLAQDEAALQEIDAALRRIEAGTYGICEETGRRIPAARLRAVPWTRYCKEVQEQLELQGLNRQVHLAPPSDVHGPLERREPVKEIERPARKKSKAERRNGGPR